MNRLTKDPIRVGKVARLELLIEDHGVCGAMEMFAQAIENIQETKAEDSEEFLNYQHSLDVIEFVMNATDLDYQAGCQSIRTDKFDQLKNDISSIQDVEKAPAEIGYFEQKWLFLTDIIFYLGERFSFSQAFNLAKITKRVRGNERTFYEQ